MRRVVRVVRGAWPLLWLMSRRTGKAAVEAEAITASRR